MNANKNEKHLKFNKKEKLTYILFYFNNLRQNEKYV